MNVFEFQMKQIREKNERILVIGSTSKLVSQINSGLFRKHMFEKAFYFGLAGLEERREMGKKWLLLEQDSENENATDQADSTCNNKFLDYFAMRTGGLTTSSIQKLCYGINLKQLNSKSKTLSQESFENAYWEMFSGLSKSSSLTYPKQRKRLAVHECGHALVAWFQTDNSKPVIKVTILPSYQNGTLGYAAYSSDTNSANITVNAALANMSTSLAGRCAEDVYFKGNMKLGAKSDIRKSTETAYQLIAIYGLTPYENSTLKNINSENRWQINSEKTKENIDTEVQKLVAERYEVAKTLLIEKRDLLEKMVARILEKETLYYDDLVEILGPRGAEIEGVEEAGFDYGERAKFLDQRELHLPEGLKYWERCF